MKKLVAALLLAGLFGCSDTKDNRKEDPPPAAPPRARVPSGPDSREFDEIAAALLREVTSYSFAPEDTGPDGKVKVRVTDESVENRTMHGFDKALLSDALAKALGKTGKVAVIKGAGPATHVCVCKVSGSKVATADTTTEVRTYMADIIKLADRSVAVSATHDVKIVNAK